MGLGTYFTRLFRIGPALMGLVLDVQGLRGEFRAWRRRYEKLKTQRAAGQVDDQQHSEGLGTLFLEVEARTLEVLREARAVLTGLVGK